MIHPSGPVVKSMFHRVNPLTTIGPSMMVPRDATLCTPRSGPSRSVENPRTFTALVVRITFPFINPGLPIGEIEVNGSGTDVGGGETGVGF